MLGLPFTPESDQSQISPPAPPEILRHTVRRTWLLIAYSDERWLWYKFSLSHLRIFSLKGWENVLCELWSERVNQGNVMIWKESKAKADKGVMLKMPPTLCSHGAPLLINFLSTFSPAWNVSCLLVPQSKPLRPWLGLRDRRWLPFQVTLSLPRSINFEIHLEPHQKYHITLL